MHHIIAMLLNDSCQYNYFRVIISEVADVRNFPVLANLNAQTSAEPWRLSKVSTFVQSSPSDTVPKEDVARNVSVNKPLAGLAMRILSQEASYILHHLFVGHSFPPVSSFHVMLLL